MPGSLRIVTANVFQGLSGSEARTALSTVLEVEPDMVGLQEWYVVRRHLLPRQLYRWRAPLLGGCVVGVRRERLELVSGRTHWLSRPGRADRGEGRWGWEPGRAACLVRCRDRGTGQLISVISYHLVSGVQAHDRYRADRPLLVARHQAEAARLRLLVESERAAGRVVVAMGDSNQHGFSLPGLTSSWSAEDQRGTHGPRRQIDDVFAEEPATAVRLLETGSDHRAVVVDRGR